MLSNIEAERVRRNLSRVDIAKKLEVSSRTYINWINEDTDIPSSALLRLAAIFGTSIEYLLEGSRFATVTTK